MCCQTVWLPATITELHLEFTFSICNTRFLFTIPGSVINSLQSQICDSLDQFPVLINVNQYQLKFWTELIQNTDQHRYQCFKIDWNWSAVGIDRGGLENKCLSIFLKEIRLVSIWFDLLELLSPVCETELHYFQKLYGSVADVMNFNKGLTSLVSYCLFLLGEFRV